MNAFRYMVLAENAPEKLKYFKYMGINTYKKTLKYGYKCLLTHLKKRPIFAA